MSPPSGQGCAEIEIANDGSHPLDLKTYGSSIIIRRKLTQNARGDSFNSKYEIANGDTKVIVAAGSKAHLDPIKEHFYLMEENPVMLLDQETSKSFLNGKPEDQYDFFMRVSRARAHMQSLATHRHNTHTHTTSNTSFFSL